MKPIIYLRSSTGKFRCSVAFSRVKIDECEPIPMHRTGSSRPITPLHRAPLAPFLLTLPLLGGINQCDSESQPLEPSAIVVNSNYRQANVSSITLDDYAVTDEETSAYQDSVVQVLDGYVFVTERQYASGSYGYVRIFDPEIGLQEVLDLELGESVNPQFVAKSDNKLYISLYNSTKLDVYDVDLEGRSAAFWTEIDLSAYDPGDGSVEASPMVALDGRVYVGIQRWNAQWNLVPPSYVVEIDVATDSIVRDLALLSPNPISMLPTSDRHLLVECAGGYNEDYSDRGDGAIEVLNLETLQSEGALVTEEQLGGALYGMAIAAGQGYLRYTDEAYVGYLERFDLRTGELEGEPSGAASIASVGIIGANRQGELWVSDGSLFWILDGSTGERLNETGVDAGSYAPYSLAFYED